MKRKNPYHSKRPRKGKWFLDKREAEICTLVNGAFECSEHYTNHLDWFLAFVMKTYPDIQPGVITSLRQKHMDFQTNLNELYGLLQNKMVAASETNTLLWDSGVRVSTKKKHKDK